MAPKKTKASIAFICYVLFLAAHASIAQTGIRQVYCETTNDILNAFDNARPGDEIIIAPGRYIPTEKYVVNSIAARFYAISDGTETSPITVRSEDPDNPAVLSGPENIYDGYVMRLRGDYWILKDLIMQDGSKGLVLDDSDHSQILNVTIHDIAQEALHIRDGSSHTLIDGCRIYNIGVKNPGNGEACYVGSDRKVHPGNVDPGERSFDPKCDHTIIQNCTFGPNVRAEGVDVKEGTSHTIIRDCTFSATGISNQTSANAFIDLKGVYGFVYNNTFNVDGEPNLEAGVDVQDRKTVDNTGYRNAIFTNIFNLGPNSEEIPTVRFQGGDPLETHAWDNTRVPNTPEPIDYYSDEIANSCPSWNVEPCGILSVYELDKFEKIEIFPNPVRDYLQIYNPTKVSVAIMIKNIGGQNIWTGSNVSEVQKVSMKNVASGMYFVEFITPGGISWTQKILKN